MTDTVKVYDRIAEEWNERKKGTLSALFPLLKSARKKGISLDAGCGNGRNLIGIAKGSEFAYGIDASKEMIRLAEKKIKENKLEKTANLIRADVQKLPFENEFFDNVFCLAVLHHLETEKKREKAVSEFGRVLKKGGILLISVWNRYQKRFEKEGKDCKVKWRKDDGKTEERFYHLFEEEELKKLIEGNGFKAGRVFYEKDGKEAKKEGAANLCIVANKAP